MSDGPLCFFYQDPMINGWIITKSIQHLRQEKEIFFVHKDLIHKSDGDESLEISPIVNYYRFSGKWQMELYENASFKMPFISEDRIRYCTLLPVFKNQI